MGISEEEHIRRLTQEKNDMGNTAKWVAIVSAVYFALMVFYGHPTGVLAMSGAVFIVSTATWLKNVRRSNLTAWRWPKSATISPDSRRALAYTPGSALRRARHPAYPPAACQSFRAPATKPDSPRAQWQKSHPAPNRQTRIAVKPAPSRWPAPAPHPGVEAIAEVNGALRAERLPGQAAKTDNPIRPFAQGERPGAVAVLPPDGEPLLQRRSGLRFAGERAGGVEALVCGSPKMA